MSAAPAFFAARLEAVADAAGMTVERLRASQHPHAVALRDWLLYAHVVTGHPAARISAWLGRREHWQCAALRRAIERWRAGEAMPNAVVDIVTGAEERAQRHARRRMPERVFATAAREAAIARVPLALVLSPSANREVAAVRARVYVALHVPRRTSIPRIAQWFNRDHTTVEYALRRLSRAPRRGEAA